MSTSWLGQRQLWVLAVAILVAGASGAAVWATHDHASTLERDCATVQDLGRQTYELGTWMNNGAFDNTNDVVERQSALSDKMRAAANSVTTREMQKPLTIWADAISLDARLQHQANNSGASAPPMQWMVDANKANLLTEEALDTLDRQCPGLKQAVQAR